MLHERVQSVAVAQNIPQASIKKVSTLTLSHPPHPNPPTRNPRETTAQNIPHASIEGVHIDVITPPPPPHPKPQREIQPVEKYARLHARFYTRWHKHDDLPIKNMVIFQFATLNNQTVFQEYMIHL